MPTMTPHEHKTAEQTADLLRQTAINNARTAVTYLQSAILCLESGAVWEVEKMLAKVGEHVMLAGGNARAALLSKIVLSSIHIAAGTLAVVSTKGGADENQDA